jgi:hypothetical protein
MPSISKSVPATIALKASAEDITNEMMGLNPPMSPVEMGQLAPYHQEQEDALQQHNLVDDALWRSLLNPENSGTLGSELFNRRAFVAIIFYSSLHKHTGEDSNKSGFICSIPSSSLHV